MEFKSDDAKKEPLDKRLGYGADPKLMVCGGCGIEDGRVEAGGIYYCPNPFCSATGATNVRVEAGMQTYEAESGSSLMTDKGAWLWAWMLRNAETWGAKVPAHYKRFRSEE